MPCVVRPAGKLSFTRTYYVMKLCFARFIKPKSTSWRCLMIVMSGDEKVAKAGKYKLEASLSYLYY